MFLKDGKIFNIDAAYTFNDVQYPAGAFRDPSLRQQFNITEQADPILEDPRYYWISQTPDGMVTQTPRSAESVQKDFISQWRQYASSTLSQSDWRIIKGVETGAAVSAELTAYRAAVRAESNRLEAEMLAAETIPQLKAVVASVAWPVDPTVPVIQ